MSDYQNQVEHDRAGTIKAIRTALKAYIDPNCTRHGAHEYHGKPQAQASPLPTELPWEVSHEYGDGLKDADFL